MSEYTVTVDQLRELVGGGRERHSSSRPHATFRPGDRSCPDCDLTPDLVCGNDECKATRGFMDEGQVPKAGDQLDLPLCPFCGSEQVRYVGGRGR